MSHPATVINVTGDIVAGLATVGSLFGYLPTIAAGMAVIYYLIQFTYWLRNRKRD